MSYASCLLVHTVDYDILASEFEAEYSLSKYFSYCMQLLISACQASVPFTDSAAAHYPLPYTVDYKLLDFI